MKQYSPDDKEGVFQLSATVYGEPFDEEEWTWSYENSPLRPARIYLAESEGRIIGLRIFPYREVKVRNDVFISVLAVGGMVHPDFRRRGIWSALMRDGLESLRSEGIHLALSFPGTHRHSYVGFRKMGWSDLGTIPLLVKPLRLDGFLSKLVRSERVRSSTGRLSRFLARSYPRKRPPQAGDLSIERIQSFDDRFDLLWEEASRQQMASVVRDQRYLNYRYRDRPGDKYVVFAAYRGRELAGYVVVRRALQMLDLSIGLIMEIETMGKTDVARFLLYEAISALDEEGVDGVGCLMMQHSPCYRVLRQGGFFPVPGRFNPRDYHPVVEADPSKFSRAVMADRGNWYFTWGDFDVD
jgi:GNAT superfamily N-acetyltransferase